MSAIYEDYEEGQQCTVLMTSASEMGYNIRLEDLAIQFRRYKVNNVIQNYYDMKIQRNKLCSIPIDRSFMKSYTISRGNMDLSQYNFISGNKLPDQIVVAMVDEDAHSGTLTKSPYNFKHNNILSAHITVNGTRHPHNGYQFDINNREYIKPFVDMLDNVGISNEDRDIWITKEDYIGGTFIIAYDRSDDMCNRFHRHPTIYISGTININIRLRTMHMQIIKVSMLDI